jgi:hypothetical protein
VFQCDFFLKVFLMGGNHRALAVSHDVSNYKYLEVFHLGPSRYLM